MKIASRCVCCGNLEMDRSPAILMPFIADRVFGWKPVKITDEWGLTSIQNGYAYSVCNTLQCKLCHHLFLDIRFDDEEMLSLYDRYRGEEYTRLRELYEPGYISANEAYGVNDFDYVSDVENFIRSYDDTMQTILDFGGGSGQNTPFKERNVHLYDISDVEVVDRVEKVDIVTIKNSAYDLVVISNVLEHIPYPKKMLEEIAAYMHSKTLLYIEVPLENLIKNAQDVSRLAEKKRYWHEHINFFTAKSLSILLESCGFEIVKMGSLSIHSPASATNVYQVLARKIRSA